MAFRSWFPLALNEQAAFYRNFTQAFIEYADLLGFSAEDVAKLEADNAVMQFLAKTQRSVDVFKKAFQYYRDNMTKGLSRNMNEFMPFQTIEIPPTVAPNMFDRLFHLSDRIVNARNYERFIGERLGIIPKSQRALIADELEPKLKVKAVGDGKLEIRFVRGKTSGINFYYKLYGNDETHDLGRFFYSPAIVDFPLRDGKKPEQVRIFARYLIGNDAVGHYSPTTEIVVAP